MNDDVKKALEMVPHGHKADHAQLWAHLKVLAAHLDAEPERLAATVAREREEQREACARQFNLVRRPERPMSKREAFEIVRATPLTATPLADRIAKLEATLRLERDLFRETFFTPADKRAEKAEAERDAALARVKELEREAEEIEQDSHAWDKAMDEEEKAFAKGANEWMRHLLGPDWGRLWGPHLEAFGRGVDNMMVRVGKAEAERDTALARAKELEADVEVGKETCRRHGTTRATAADGWPASKLIGFLSHSLAGKDAAIKDAAESASQLRSERDTLKAQLAEAVEVLASLCDQIRQGRGFDTLEARAFLAKYPEGR